MDLVLDILLKAAFKSCEQINGNIYEYKIVGNIVEVAKSKDTSILNPDTILWHIRIIYNVTEEQIKSKYRFENYAEARFAAYYALRFFSKMKLKEIGRLMGYRDHSTVLSGIRKFQDLCDYDLEYRYKFNTLVRELNNEIPPKEV